MAVPTNWTKTQYIAEIERLTALVATRDSEALLLQAEITQLTGEKAALATQLADANTSITSLNASLAAASTDLAEAEAEVAAAGKAVQFEAFCQQVVDLYNEMHPVTE